jgi:hypothetical protein
LLSFVVLFAAVLVRVAAALRAVLVVRKTEIHQNCYYYHHFQEHMAFAVVAFVS